MELWYLSAGLLIGFLLAWIIAWYRYQAKANIISANMIAERYVLKEVFQQVQQQADGFRADLHEKEQEIRDIMQELAAKKQQVVHMETQMRTNEAAVSQLQHHFQTTFENVANKLLEEKSARFTAQNQEQMGRLLQPLREKIQDFEQGIQHKYIEETKDRSALRTEIEQLHLLNQQLSKDANNLVRALKGDAKFQGNWGEYRLETLLEKAGLVKEVHFKTQMTFIDTEGQMKRPDFLILLPGDKHLILDAKVSLTAFEQYNNEEDEKSKARHLKAHIDSLRNHIRELSNKNYQHLYQINTPDYLMLFVPLEPALALAQQQDEKLFEDAMAKNIVIVTPSTLLVTMRTVSYIWQQEKQKNNVLEIARQSGLLYDKFCAFVEHLKDIGQRLDHAKNAYDDAMNKLSDSKRFGDTLIGRAEKIRELGAKASRQLPKDLLE